MFERARILTEEQKAFYVQNNYVLVKNVIPTELLHLAEAILSRWVDDTIFKWYEEGRLASTLNSIDFHHRLVQAWEAAGRPNYARSPRRDLVSPYMYEFLKFPELVDLASDFLGSDEISVHGIFNARPKLPDQVWTNTPWHQDAQYYRDAEKKHVVSMWIPLQRVTEHNSCLQVGPGVYDNQLLDGTRDAETDFIGLTKEQAAALTPISIEMDPGDVLCFNQLLPHRAVSNHSDTVRWSMDIRYESTDDATETGKRQGFVARSLRNPDQETGYKDWLLKWADIPAGRY